MAWNGVTGPYRTQYDRDTIHEGKRWPLYNWSGIGGVWYPQPTLWAELSCFAPAAAADPRPIIVTIRRDGYVGYYTGHNEHGPCWSSISKFHSVRNLEDLRALLKDIARHEPTVRARATLLPDFV